MKSLPYNQVTYEQYLVGDDLYLTILAQPQEVEMVYADPSEVKQIRLKDESSAEYIDLVLINKLFGKTTRQK